VKKKRKNRGAKEKAAILRPHSLEGAVAAYQQKPRPAHEAAQARIAYLEKRIQTKDDLQTELTADQLAPGKEPESL
jgi:hypothetical protein